MFGERTLWGVDPRRVRTEGSVVWIDTSEQNASGFFAVLTDGVKRLLFRGG